ncbi:oxidoreductase [Rhodococcus sp. 05-340-1]|uniref:PDR/VanB family oxidoreductase n=2 Tax=Rhodococcus TaxID=1827 RepID=UPI000B9C1ED8|nr:MULTISPECIES: PDR/VanB family oxidoreductase [unclassified Rhodococcus (in: high G+C Gram-positive bacteria)]OZC87674.1 oxidoreductase [Rhodococcus sp. 06-412-2C]OZC96325.1 oxidoreductase [Rhodococcus sp. 06-412-2B]OZD65308.1 oxidoreductase [Rhodococcus sp. 05-340-2]OZD74645.1 oxidoreductase [Rhodococcus sp. 05-340-1]
MTADLTLTVTGKTALTEDVVQLELSSTERKLPTWDAGAHIDLQCGSHLRTYSLCGDPDDHKHYRIAVLREPSGRGGSAHVHDVLAIGDTVDVSLPRNHFRLADAQEYVFIAGGIGITPIIPMIAAARSRGIPWSLYYGGRSRAAMAYVDELSALGEMVELFPQDECGPLPLSAILGAVVHDAKIFCCGPPALLDAATKASSHWPTNSLHIERFIPKDIEEATDYPFDVHLARRGTTHHVPADRSILDVLNDAGVNVPTSCGVGTCGTCELAVVAGTPEHRDSVLTLDEQAEGQYMMPCVSRSATTTLTLDL